MINISKNKVLKLSICEISESSFKKEIFKGKIIIINISDEMKEIIDVTNRYFFEIFDSTKNNLINSKSKHELNRFFNILQSRVKNCKILRNNFKIFLEKLGFTSSKTFMDMITLRYSPAKGRQKLGSLKPAPPHRDTWASNIFNQINLWIPIHDVKQDNSIFIVPRYFKEKVENNSSSWSYDLYKKTKKYKSVPEAKIIINEKEKIKFNLNKGEVLCFSGHHLHGSKIGVNQRINLETRIADRNDINLYNIPANLDSSSKKKKTKWFRNLETQEYY